MSKPDWWLRKRKRGETAAKISRFKSKTGNAAKAREAKRRIRIRKSINFVSYDHLPPGVVGENSILRHNETPLDWMVAWEAVRERIKSAI